MPLLVRTPAPFTNESLLGYVLRISEENGYDTPWYVFQLADINQGEMRSPNLSVRKLAAILSRNADELEPLSYATQEDVSSYKLLRHNLGRSAKDNFLRLQSPAFCPHCVQEEGHIEAFWDLSAAIACPRHHCPPISRCPECGEDITLFRPGLLRCRCGADLTKASSVAIAAHTLELMGLIKAKIEGFPLAKQPNESGLPVEALELIPLLPLLRILESLGQQVLRSRGAEIADLDRTLDAAASALADWPRGYHRELTKIGQRLAEKGLQAVGLRKQFESFYQGIFKKKRLGTHAQFLKDEFVRFGLQHWGAATVDSKMRHSDLASKARYVSKSKYAEQHGLSKLKLAQMIADGTIATKTIYTEKSARVVVDLENTQPPIKSVGIMNVRDAARQLGLPVSVLKHLRDCGVFETKVRTGRSASWHVEDVEAFWLRSLELVPQASPEVETVALSELMGRTLRDHAAKGDIVAAMFDGRLTVHGHQGDNMGGLLLARDAAEIFIRQKRQEVEDDTLSLAETASVTGLDKQVVLPAVRMGLLTATERDGRTRVTVGSIAEFSATYVPLVVLAKDLGTLPQHLWRFCRKNGFDTLSVMRSNGGPAMPLLRLSAKEGLLAAWEEAHREEDREPAAKPAELYEAAIRAYLVELEAERKMLPRRAGTPNKAVIARACGFHRDVLYSYPNVIALLTEHDQRELEASINWR